jgi:hypothetical protein
MFFKIAGAVGIPLAPTRGRGATLKTSPLLGLFSRPSIHYTASKNKHLSQL